MRSSSSAGVGPGSATGGFFHDQTGAIGLIQNRRFGREAVVREYRCFAWKAAVSGELSGVVVFVLLAAGKPHALGRYLIAASVIPIGDAIIVLRGNGPKATAYGVHGTTAAVMLGTAALLLSGPE